MEDFARAMADFVREHQAWAAPIVLLLAFGIGANTLIFTAVDVLLLRDQPQPYGAPAPIEQSGPPRELAGPAAMPKPAPRYFWPQVSSTLSAFTSSGEKL